MNNRKKILMSVGLFIAIMFGGTAQVPCTLHQINREIANTRNSIDSLRNTHAKTMTRHLCRNSDYQYIRNHSADIDTLRILNERLMDLAVTFIRKKHPTALIYRTPFIFTQYRDVPEVSRFGRMYRQNNETIRAYDRRAAEFHPQYLEIKNRCDSAMYAQIDIYQRRLDSLLNRKIELIR